jgi:carbon monoxide dehydrogenase subunit G
LYDPEILKQCIPGCQSLIKESDDRMRATVDIKIGPIGARFNGTVTLSDLEPQSGYTLTIEGQGGTVGFIKSRAKVRLANDDNGGTLLNYDVDAQLGGRLVQLGGPIIDATAKQLATKFFQQFGSVVGKPLDSPAAAEPTGATPSGGSNPAAAATRSPATTPAPHAARQHGLPIAWILALVVAALVGYLVGHTQRGGDSDWMGLAIGLLVLIVGAAGFEFGRRAAAPVVVLDPALLARLMDEGKR